MTTISDKDRADAQAMAETLTGTTPHALSDDAIRRWLNFRDQVLASHTCQPVWRPTTSAEIQPGWEVRSRRETGMPSSWGIAHHRDEDGDWRTWPEDAVLTYDADGWTCETTAPVPEPNPRIQVVLDWASEPPGQDRHADAVDLLTRLDNLKENTP